MESDEPGPGPLMAGTLPVALRRRALPGTLAATRIEAALPFLLGALLTGLLAGDQGGYWPTAWGWATLALLWAAGTALALREGRMSRLELAWIGGLAAITGWTALSLVWTDSRTQTALEVERALVYATAALAAAAVLRSAGYRGLLWGVWAGSTIASIYALATRLLPERLGVSDVAAGYRLSSPVGYWNGLGLLVAVAAMLAVGLAAFGRPVAGRATAAASLPLLLPTLYFTFSRGAWIALGAALAAAVAISPRRLRLVSALLVQAAPAAAAIWLAYRAKPLRLENAPPGEALRAGHALAWKLALLAFAAAVLAIAYGWAARRVRFPDAVRLGYAALLAATVLGGVAAVLVHYGGPAGIVSHARHSIDSAGAGNGTDLSTRFFSLSNNARLDQWHVALDEWHANPVLGSGAGTYAQYWVAERSNAGQVLDVHNLYLETLGELGVVGLVLLAAVLLVPLAAAFRARDRTLSAAAAGAYVAWLVHVAYDWDWELPGVTVAAFLCASALLAAARGRGRHVQLGTLRWPLLAGVLVTGAAATLGLLGNRALARSSTALHRGNLVEATAAAQDARRWAPWSAQPWQQLAVIRTREGDRAGARAAYQEAVAKDPRSWQLWAGLASVSSGAVRAQALARLEPLAPAVRKAITAKRPGP